MRRLEAVVTIAWLIGASFGAPVVSAQEAVEDALIAEPIEVDDPIVPDDQALSEFEERALAAGALGFYRDEESSSIVVLVPTSLSDSFDLAQLKPIAVRMRVEYASIEAAYLETVRARVLRFPEDTPSRGSMAFYFDPRSKLFEIVTTFDAEALASYLGEAASLVNIRYGETTPASRVDDAPPHWGGAKIKYIGNPDPDEYCTTGFTVSLGGTRRMATAAHCGPAGFAVKDWSNNHTIGTIGNVHCGNLTMPTDNSDVEWIAGGNYNPQIYIGGSTGNRADVTEAGTPAVGASYRYSGATTFEKSGQVVTSTDASTWWDDAADFCNPGDGGGWWQLHLMSWQRSGVCDAIGGDSGAPFFVKYADSPYPDVGIRGFVSSRNPTFCLGEKWPRIQSLLGGASIVTA